MDVPSSERVTLKDLEPVLLWSSADFCEGWKANGSGSAGCEVSLFHNEL